MRRKSMGNAGNDDNAALTPPEDKAYTSIVFCKPMTSAAIDPIIPANGPANAKSKRDDLFFGGVLIGVILPVIPV